MTLRFDDGQILDPTTIAANILVTRTNFDDTFNGNDVSAPIGYVGIGDKSNEIVIRFSSTLPDDKYRIRILGGLKNSTGDLFNNGNAKTVDFDLNLGPQVISVVPQPITRDANGVLSQSSNTVEVYFNNDDLNPLTAQNVSFYQLIRTNDTATNLDDGSITNPTSAVYDNLTDKVTLTFAAGVLTSAGTFRLRIGNSDPVPTAPVTIGVLTDPADTLRR